MAPILLSAAAKSRKGRGSARGRSNARRGAARRGEATRKRGSRRKERAGRLAGETRAQRRARKLRAERWSAPRSPRPPRKNRSFRLAGFFSPIHATLRVTSFDHYCKHSINDLPACALSQERARRHPSSRAKARDGCAPPLWRPSRRDKMAAVQLRKLVKNVSCLLRRSGAARPVCGKDRDVSRRFPPAHAALRADAMAPTFFDADALTEDAITTPLPRSATTTTRMSARWPFPVRQEGGFAFSATAARASGGGGSGAARSRAGAARRAPAAVLALP
jgi:hypothetical protein